jgi:putative Holliday junction resolvase
MWGGSARHVRILALDLGERRIGVAVSDPLGLTAQGLPTLESRGAARDLEAIADLCRRLEVEKVVVGLPRNMDGSYGPRAELARDYAKAIAERTGLPVATWDERLTTKSAIAVLLEADVSRRRRRAAVDRMAATLILQGYLDRLAIDATHSG